MKIKRSLIKYVIVIRILLTKYLQFQVVQQILMAGFVIFDGFSRSDSCVVMFWFFLTVQIIHNIKPNIHFQGWRKIADI